MSRRTIVAILLLAATVVMYFIGLNAGQKPSPKPPAAPEKNEAPAAPPVPASSRQDQGAAAASGDVNLPPKLAAPSEAPPPPSAARETVPSVPGTPESSTPATPSPAAVRDQDVADDLENVQFALRDFRAALGENPVGTNAEITKALTGDNLKQVKVPLPAGSQVNENGEMLDRWGTPYFFHQLSGTEMEVRSAGPDRKMWTSDDKVVK